MNVRRDFHLHWASWCAGILVGMIFEVAIDRICRDPNQKFEFMAGGVFVVVVVLAGLMFAMCRRSDEEN